MYSGRKGRNRSDHDADPAWISQLFSLKQHRVLTIWFSFDHLSLSARDGGVYLEISPKPGHDIPPLPEWLQISCIVTTSHFPSADVANPKIENGAEMKDSDGNYVGTLGTIMSATRDRQPGQLYVALTAGLTIPNGAYHVLVNNPATGADSPLEISHTSRRLQDKRIQLAEDKPEFFSGAAFLIIPPDIVNYFALGMYNINAHSFNDDDEDPPRHWEKRQPTSRLRYRHIKKLLEAQPNYSFSTRVPN